MEKEVDQSRTLMKNHETKAKHRDRRRKAAARGWKMVGMRDRRAFDEASAA